MTLKEKFNAWVQFRNRERSHLRKLKPLQVQNKQLRPLAVENRKCWKDRQEVLVAIMEWEKEWWKFHKEHAALVQVIGNEFTNVLEMERDHKR